MGSPSQELADQTVSLTSACHHARPCATSTAVPCPQPPTPALLPVPRPAVEVCIKPGSTVPTSLVHHAVSRCAGATDTPHRLPPARHGRETPATQPATASPESLTPEPTHVRLSRFLDERTVWYRDGPLGFADRCDPVLQQHVESICLTDTHPAHCRIGAPLLPW